MDKVNWYNGSCDVVNAFTIISGHWRLPILCKLFSGRIRYNELKRQVNGITNIMLTRSLQDLEEHELVGRIQYSEVPLILNMN